MADRNERKDQADQELPNTIGAYRLGPRIAQGGFGVVYRAEHIESGAPAALKVIHAELASSPVMVARFEREIATIQRVEHPGVVRVLEQGRLADGRPYFVMELLHGDDLSAHLKARGRLPASEVVEIFEPLCAVVAAAHARAIIHRDIKASNVMLAREGERMRVVLLDFGVAKLLDDEGPKLTASRHLVGTLSCMAPEQILTRPVDERTDVYALGILAYRLLTGEAPFAARSVLALQQMHLAAVPRPPSALVPLPPPADAVILRALAKQPDERYPGAPAFFEELRAALLSSEAARPAEQRVVAVLVEVHAPRRRWRSRATRSSPTWRRCCPRAASSSRPWASRWPWRRARRSSSPSRGPWTCAPICACAAGCWWRPCRSSSGCSRARGPTPTSLFASRPTLACSRSTRAESPRAARCSRSRPGCPRDRRPASSRPARCSKVWHFRRGRSPGPPASGAF
ncbi:MAG: serine/threonine-protein kinase [Polyangiaceae bacterium]